jgi:hypothetical protein
MMLPLKGGLSCWQRRGLSVADALRAAGITPRYFSRTSGGRSINLLLNLAKALDVQPADLLGLNEPPSVPALPVDSEKLQRIVCAAKLMTAQMAAFIYVASDGSDADPAALIEAVRRGSTVRVARLKPKIRRFDVSRAFRKIPPAVAIPFTKYPHALDH